MKTLNLKFPIGQTFAQALISLIILLFLLEGFVRIQPIKKYLSKYEFYGSANAHFDIQVRNIRARAETSGKIDCIFIGSSQVLYGVDPAIVEDVYYKKTGKRIICQNFGIAGLSPITAVPVIKVLIKNFHPSVIILGTNVLDYSSTYAGKSNASVMTSPWLRYQLGDFSVDGWLIENSRSYQYYLGMDHYILGGNDTQSGIEENGHSQEFSGNAHMTLAEQANYFHNLIPSNPKLLKKQVKALSNILKFQTNATKIIIMETPMTPKMLDFNKKVKRIHPEFIDLLKRVTGRAKSGLWLTQTELSVPEDGWYDLIHLNKIGSAYFSKILGKKLAVDPFLTDK
jgi:hypothetical protein